MRAVNLLPRQTSSKELGFDRTLAVGIAVTVLVAAILAGGFFLEKANAASARRQLADAQAALAQAQTPQPTTHSSGPAKLTVPVVLSQQEPWHVALDAAISTRVAWDAMLQQLEYAVPNRITLTSVTLGAAGTAASAASGAIALSGTAFSSDDVGAFMATLARLPKVSLVNLVSDQTNIGSPVHTFSITAQMTLPAALTAPPATGTTSTTTTGASG
jgi:Tfp pilus assembly protein PilN